MKNLFLSALGFLLALTVSAQYPTYSSPSARSSSATSPSYSGDAYNSAPRVQYNSGYTRSNGTVVEPYYSTQRDRTNWNNFSTEGNVNPYTGREGTRPRDYSPEALNYGQGRVIQQGPRGGQYYINDNGNKVYVPKRNNASF